MKRRNCPTNADRSSRHARGMLRRLVAAALIGCTIVTATLATAPATAADVKAAQFYEDALVRYEKKDFAGAIIQLKNALKSDNKMLPVHVLLGNALLNNSEVNAAEVAFEEALRLGVNRAEVVAPLAEAVNAQGRPQDVLQQARFADAGLPQTSRLQLLLIKAAAAGDVGNPRDAIRFLEEARALDPNRPETWLAEVPIRLRAQQFKEGLAAADRALALAPGSVEALYQRGTVSHLQGELKAALAHYDRTLLVSPAHADALISRAGILLDLKRGEEAAQDVAALRKAAVNDPRGAYLAALLAERAGDGAASRKALSEVTALLDVVPMPFLRYRTQLLILGGLAHLGLKQPEKAKPYLESAQRQQPSSGVAKLLAQVYLREKNHDRAIESLDSYLRAHPGDTQATHLLASVHLSQGRYARAASLTQEALKRQDDPAMRGLLGMSLLGTGKLTDAAKELEAAVKRDSSQIQAGSALVSLYLQSGQAQRAVDVAEAMIKRQPANAGLFNLLGTAQAQKRNVAAARIAFEQASKLAPDFVAPQIHLARLDSNANNHAAAAARLDAVLVRNEKNVDAMLELARVASQRGRDDDTRRWLEKAESHSGNSLQPSLQLVEFHLGRNRPDLAREALKPLNNKAPEALPVLLTQARVQLASTEMAPARITLNRATSLAHFDPPLLVQIAMLQLRAGNLPGAAFALDKALSERPNHLNARALMADVELRTGLPAKAEARARSIVASHPKLGLGHALLGDVAASRGQRAASIDAYHRAHDLDRNSDSLQRLFGALSTTDLSAATQVAEQWLKAKPGDLTVRRALANAQARAGNLKAARTAFEAMLVTVPDDAEVLNNLANVLILQHDASAIGVAERALALKPELAHILGTAGWAAFQVGQAERALSLLRDARLRDPANADTKYFLGAVLANRGRNAEARAELEGALRGVRVTSHAKEAEALLHTLK